MRALVTGGTGFIGGRLAHTLLDRGHHVRLLVRPQSVHKAKPLADRGAEIAEGDIVDRPSIVQAGQGCDVAFHVAALVGAGLPIEDFYRFNVDGTQNVIEACERAHIHKLVHVSTESVLVDFRDHQGDEASVTYPARYYDGYSETKAAAERAVLAAHEAGRVVAAVLRPCWVWGPGDTTILPPIVRLAKAGLFTWVGGGGKRTTPSYVDNVVHALILAAERPESAGEVFFVGDDEEVTVREFVTGQLRACGIDRWYPSVPFPMGLASARLFEKAYHLLGYTGQPPLNAYGIALLGCEQFYSVEKSKRLLGYRPVTSVRDGYAALGRWVSQLGGPDALVKLAIG